MLVSHMVPHAFLLNACSTDLQGILSSWSNVWIVGLLLEELVKAPCRLLLHRPLSAQLVLCGQMSA